MSRESRKPKDMEKIANPYDKGILRVEKNNAAKPIENDQFGINVLLWKCQYILRFFTVKSFLSNFETK